MLDRTAPAAASLGHAHHPTQEASMTLKPPSARQLNYLKALAHRTGQTFAYPATSSDASREIQRLKTVRSSSRIERTLERLDVGAEQLARETNCDVPVDPSEIQGDGSTATWGRRS
jgi:hypothetical protein